LEKALKSDILITIVVTVYNKSDFIDNCLNSIINQTDKRYNVIIIDDGSNDDSLSKCLNKKNKFTNIDIHSVSHIGIAAVKNLAIKITKTKYILFIDGDDTISEDTISKLNKSILSYNYDLVIFGINHINMKNEISARLFHPELICKSYSEMQNAVTSLWSADIMYSSCNKLYNINIIESKNIRFPDKDFGEDLDFVCNYFLHCKSLHNIEECLYYYTQHRTNSLSKKYRSNIFEIRKYEHEYMNNFFNITKQTNTISQEFLAKRHIERIIGCIESEASFYNKKCFYKKIKSINTIISDKYTIECMKKVKIQGKKLKILSYPIKHQMPCLCFVFGLVMTIFRNVFPNIFLCLKANR